MPSKWKIVSSICLDVKESGKLVHCIIMTSEADDRRRYGGKDAVIDDTIGCERAREIDWLKVKEVVVSKIRGLLDKKLEKREGEIKDPFPFRWRRI